MDLLKALWNWFPGGDVIEKAKFISIILGIVFAILTFRMRLWNSARLRSIDATTRETLKAVKRAQSNKPEPCATEAKANANEGFRTFRAGPLGTEKSTAKDAERYPNMEGKIPNTAVSQPRSPENKKPEERQAGAAGKGGNDKQSADLRKQANDFREMARRCEARINWREAENYYHKEAELAEKLRDWRRLAEIYRETARRYEARNMWREADSYYLKALNIKEP